MSLDVESTYGGSVQVPPGFTGQTRKAAFAEKASQKYAKENLGAVKIISKGDNPNANGVDMFFKDRNGDWNIADAKHFDKPGHSVSPSDLKTTIHSKDGYELSDDWIRRQLDDLEKSGNIDAKDLAEINNAFAEGKLQRHVIVTHSTGSGIAGPKLLNNDLRLENPGHFAENIKTHAINIDDLESRW